MFLFKLLLTILWCAALVIYYLRKRRAEPPVSFLPADRGQWFSAPVSVIAVNILGMYVVNAWLLSPRPYRWVWKQFLAWHAAHPWPWLTIGLYAVLIAAFGYLLWKRSRFVAVPLALGLFHLVLKFGFPSWWTMMTTAQKGWLVGIELTLAAIVALLVSAPFPFRKPLVLLGLLGFLFLSARSVWALANPAPDPVNVQRVQELARQGHEFSQNRFFRLVCVGISDDGKRSWAELIWFKEGKDNREASVHSFSYLDDGRGGKYQAWGVGDDLVLGKPRKLRTSVPLVATVYFDPIPAGIDSVQIRIWDVRQNVFISQFLPVNRVTP